MNVVARSSQLRVAGYGVAVELDPVSDGFRSRTTVRFSADSAGETFADLQAQRVDAVRLNGRMLDPANSWDGTRLLLDDLGSDNVLEVDAWFSFDDQRGLIRRRDRGDEAVYVYARSYPENASRWFCCFNEPELSAPVRLRVRVPPGWTCLANAPAATADELGWRQFAASQPLPPCTVALAAGPMACWHGPLQTARRSVPLEIAAPASRAGAVADPVRLVETITTSVDRLEELLNLPLPTEKLSIIFAQDYPVLGLSAPGLITFHHAVLDAASIPSLTPRFTVTIAHELAHAWFGGQMEATRQDAWLLEAAATYLSRQVLATVWPGCDPSQRDLGRVSNVLAGGAGIVGW